MLTPSEIEQVTGMAAHSGTVMEVRPGATGCSFGTRPFDVRVNLTQSSSGSAAAGLGAGDVVDDLGDGARWVYCEECLDADQSSSSNLLVVAQDLTYLFIAFEPTTDEAANEAASLQAAQRAWAIDLAQLALPRLVTAAPPASPSPASALSSAPAVGQPPASASDQMPEPHIGQPFGRSVPELSEVSVDPAVVLQSAALALLLVFLMPFPSQLFNSTLETHEDEVRRWLRLDRIGRVATGIGALWASWVGVAVFTLLAALLYGFLDPSFGVDLGSLATFLGMLLGIVLVTVAFAVPLLLVHRRHGDRPSVKVVPISLVVGVACVLLSRLTSFQPGYLYGLLIGFAFARELTAAEEGPATALSAVVMLVTALVAWLVIGVLPDEEALGLVVVRTALAALMVAGLEGVVFGLLPMRFLPGESLYAWNRLAWGTLLAIGAFAFFHILINPASGYLSDTTRTPLLTVLALLVGFCVVSVAFWAWFRYRPEAGDAPMQQAGL